MESITIHPSEETLRQARALAMARDTTVDELLTGFIDKLFRGEPIDLITGMFADEPELVDKLLADVVRDRERRFSWAVHEPDHGDGHS